MRACFCLLILLTTTSCSSTPPSPESVPAQSGAAVAFLDVTLIPMTADRVLPSQTVVVQDGRIAAVGTATNTSVPEGAARIDGKGKYLIPGLAEMHGHIPPPTATPEFIESVLFMYVANGITTVRGMLGAPGQLELREKANRGELMAPTLYLAGPSFSGSSINSPEEAVERVRQQKREGWDLLKVHPGLTRQEYDAMAQTAREVGIRFAGHVPQEVGLVHAIEMGQETFDHIDGYIEYLQGDKGPLDEAKLAEVVRMTRDAGAWVVPTLALWETLWGTVQLETLQSYPELKYMPPEQVKQWVSAYEKRVQDPKFDLVVSRRVIENRQRVLKALNDGGVKILMGTDAPQQFSVPGFSLHRELPRMVAAGMSPYDILKSGTLNVGMYFKDKDNFGTIEVGKRADLILLEADPLADVANIARRSGVMVRGKWIPEQDIQSRLDQIAASYR